MRKFTPIFITYNSSQQVPTNCNSITFVNLGTSICSVESVQLQPTQSLAITGNTDEFMDSVIAITFSGEGNNNLVVVKKVY